MSRSRARRLELSDPRLLGLDNLRRKRRWSHAALALKLGVCRRTVEIWKSKNRLPVNRWSQVDSLLGRVSSPKPGWEVRESNIGRTEAEKRQVGYAAVWMSTSVAGIPLVLVTDPEKPLAQVTRWGDDRPEKTVRIFVENDRLCYAAFQIVQGGALLPVVEGVATTTGLEFCREFLAEGRTPVRTRGKRLENALRKSLHNH